MTKKTLIHVYPVPGVSIPPADFVIRAVEQDVTEDTWEYLSGFVPPAFTTTPPDGAAIPLDDVEDKED